MVAKHEALIVAPPPEREVFARRHAETCTQERWSAGRRNCVLNAVTTEQLQKCSPAVAKDGTGNGNAGTGVAGNASGNQGGGARVDRAPQLTPKCADVSFSRACWLPVNGGRCHAWIAYPAANMRAVWRGRCRDDALTGGGSLRSSTGQVEVGTFDNGRLVDGTLWLKGLLYQKGHFSEDRFVGVVSAVPGERFEGTVILPTTPGAPLVADGVLTKPDGARWEGRFHNWRPQGSVKIYEPGGFTREATADANGQLTGLVVELHAKGTRKITSEYRAGSMVNGSRKYYVQVGNGWKPVTETEWKQRFDLTTFEPPEVWAFRPSGSKHIAMSFRVRDRDARELYDALNLPVTRVRHSDPGYVEHSKNLVQGVPTPEWLVKTATSGEPGGVAYQRLTCYRWARTLPPPPRSLDICRFDVVAGAMQATIRIAHHGSYVITLSHGPETGAPALYDALNATAKRTRIQYSSVNLKSRESSSARWRIACWEYLDPQGNPKKDQQLGGVIRNCDLNFRTRRLKPQEYSGSSYAGPSR